MRVDQAFIERYELKYRIPPAQVAAIRLSVQRFCEVDPASASAPYRISSLYLDSPGRRLYLQSKQRHARRLKLRVRRYLDSPLFLEVKRRTKAVVLKSRVALDPGLWPEVMLDPRVLDGAAVSPPDRARAHDFLSLCLRFHAEPAVVVRYAREAYVSTVDNYARVTFDQHIEGLLPRGYEVPIADDAGWVPFDDPTRFDLPVSGTVLELKCTSAVPLWMTDLVERFNLRPAGFSKFTKAVDAVRRFPFDLGALRQPSRWMPGEPS